MQAGGSRAVLLAALAILASGCGGGREREIVIEFVSPERCVVLGEEIARGGLAARLGREQERSAVFDTMDFRLVMAPGMSEEQYAAMEKDARDLIRGLGAGNRVVVERRAHVIVRILTSLGFWALVVLAAGGGYAWRRLKKASQ